MRYYQLTANEIYQIYVLKKTGHTQKMIASLLERIPYTISRELYRNTRNKGYRGYRPGQAQRLTRDRRQSALKYCKVTVEVRGWINQLIRQ